MPYWRLSSFYFFYFAALGALMPYWGLYLQSKGFDALAIGSLMALLMATKIVAPNVWGWLGDHIGHRMMIVRLAAAASFVIFLAMFDANTFVAVGLIMVLFSFFWNASLPQFEAVTMSHLKERIQDYSRVRLWGSVGFIISVVVLGLLLDYRGVELVPLVVLLLFIGIFLNSLVVPERGPDHPPEGQGSIMQVLRRPEVLALLLVTFLMQASHSTYYAFYSIYMENIGYSSTAIGELWALGVIAEVVLFLFMHQLLPRWGARRVLIASLIIAVVRWMLVGLTPDNLPLVLLAQLMHAATFGTFHAAAIHLIHHYFVGRHQGRGQALYSSISFGAGGAVGSLLSGYLWTGIGPQATYLVSAGYALVAVIVAWGWVDRQSTTQPA